MAREKNGLLPDLAEDPARERLRLETRRLAPAPRGEPGRSSARTAKSFSSSFAALGPVLGRAAEAVQQDQSSFRLLRGHRSESYRTGRGAVVAHLLWEQGVAGSIPAAPTNIISF